MSSAIGMVLAVAFLLRVFERPPEDQSAEERHDSSDRSVRAHAEEPISRWKILADRDLWLLTLSDFLHAYIAYIYFFWFYLYLVDVRGFSALRGSYFTVLPFVAMGLSSPFGGWLSDRMIAMVGKIRARQLVAISGLVPSSVLILVGASARSASLAVLCLALAAGFLYLSLSCYWATASEIYPTSSATVSATMNTGANLGGALSPILTAWLAARYGWISALRFAAVLGMVAAALWIFVGAHRNGSASGIGQ